MGRQAGGSAESRNRGATVDAASEVLNIRLGLIEYHGGCDTSSGWFVDLQSPFRPIDRKEK